MYFLFLHGLGIDIFNSNSVDNANLGEIGVMLMFTFIGLYILQALTLNLLPGTTTVFISGLAWFLFQGDFLVAYMVSLCAILITAFILYFYGRYAGRNVLYWMFGREKLDKKFEWFARNGTKGVPWLFLIPFFPTDLVVITCGASKMKFWQFTLMVMVFKPIEVALLLAYPLLFTSGFMQNLTPLEIIMGINLIVINVFLLILYHRGLLKLFNKTIAEPLTGRKAYKDGIEKARLAHIETQKKYEKEDMLKAGLVPPESIATCDACGCTRKVQADGTTAVVTDSDTIKQITIDDIAKETEKEKTKPKIRTRVANATKKIVHKRKGKTEE